MFSSFRFSTDDLPMQTRSAAVRELRERGLIPLEPLPGHAIHVAVSSWFLPGAGLLVGRLGGLRQEAGAQAVEDIDDLFLAINFGGASVAHQGGSQLTVEAGHGMLLSSAAGPFSITRATTVRFIGVRVPRRVMAPLLREPDAPAMRILPAGTGPLRLLTRYIQAIGDTRILAAPDVGRLIATHLHDLIALCAGATHDTAVVAEVRSVRAARLQAIKAEIGTRLADETLTLPGLAARHGVTPRYVQKLFESEGVTYTRFVLGQRLDRAYRMLRDSRWADLSISSIAYDVGFGDLSYFNRAFRQQYGATPGDVRRDASAAGPR
jgi:AraC-like DNA-binding protein